MASSASSLGTTQPHASPRSSVPPMAAAARCQHAVQDVDWLLSDLLMLSSTSPAAAIG